MGGRGAAVALGLAAAALLGCGVGPSRAFYMPGVTVVEYGKNDEVFIKVNSMKSAKTAIPYDYYSLMFCRPKSGPIQADVENFGEILWGDVIKRSRYAAQMQVDQTCTKLCSTRPTMKEKDKTKIETSQLKKLKSRINNQYRGHFILDNLPVSEVYVYEKTNSLYYKLGYPLGTPGNKTHPTLVNNHLHFTIKYHQPEGLPGFRIVGFYVVPYSVANEHIDQKCGGQGKWDPNGLPPQSVSDDPKDPTQSISWSYSVHWEEDPTTLWASRWDPYLKTSDSSNARIHWFSIFNSLLCVTLLTIMVAMILTRALHRDFNRYNREGITEEEEDDTREERGWKEVHRDVFRTPSQHRLLSVYVGTGCQIMGMVVVTLCFACAGFLSPAKRGGLLSVIVLLFVLMGCFGGFVAARLVKMFEDQNWTTIFMVGLYVPGQIYVFFFLNDLILWARGAANAVPFATIFFLIAMWFCVSVPLVVVGAVAGFRLDAVKHPRDVSKVPRTIPDQPWFMRPAFVVGVAGIIPFGSAFIELFYILSSIWMDKFYYVFGFLAVVTLILTVTCAQISIVMTYFQLCYEDWEWWWRSFFVSGSSGFYLFAYSAYYFITTLRMTNVHSMIMYFGWMFIMSYVFAVVTGTIGFLSTLMFVRTIYAALKVD